MIVDKSNTARYERIGNSSSSGNAERRSGALVADESFFNACLAVATVLMGESSEATRDPRRGGSDSDSWNEAGFKAFEDLAPILLGAFEDDTETRK